MRMHGLILTSFVKSSPYDKGAKRKPVREPKAAKLEVPCTLERLLERQREDGHFRWVEPWSLFGGYDIEWQIAEEVLNKYSPQGDVRNTLLAMLTLDEQFGECAEAYKSSWNLAIGAVASGLGESLTTIEKQYKGLRGVFVEEVRKDCEAWRRAVQAKSDLFGVPVVNYHKTKYLYWRERWRDAKRKQIFYGDNRLFEIWRGNVIGTAKHNGWPLVAMDDEKYVRVDEQWFYVGHPRLFAEPSSKLCDQLDEVALS